MKTKCKDLHVYHFIVIISNMVLEVLGKAVRPDRPETEKEGWCLGKNETDSSLVIRTRLYGDTTRRESPRSNYT